MSGRTPQTKHIAAAYTSRARTHIVIPAKEETIICLDGFMLFLGFEYLTNNYNKIVLEGRGGTFTFDKSEKEKP